jgi:hypothetical protein
MSFSDSDYSEFIGVESLVLENAYQLSKFREYASMKDWRSFHGSHYDWWAFPISAPSSYGFKYSVNTVAIESLKEDPVFLSNLRECAQLLLLSWGWDFQTNSEVPDPGVDQHWANWPIRLYKCWKSMSIFGLEVERDACFAYAKHLRRLGASFTYGELDLFQKMSHE